ncbi:MAG: AbrB/MazE/SpoVT family DNA-binding domain-containing protein [Longimicrobiales bacterium]|nr:AbrB/MazE/SpoVT family DNA-binding domain-containing protein [Longimicrobiales bacterium]
MRARVKKWGNSLALRIPHALAAEAGIEEGSEVAVSLDGGDIRVRPSRGPAFRLEELIEKITPDNLHAEVPSGPSVGREAW